MSALVLFNMALALALAASLGFTAGLAYVGAPDWLCIASGLPTLVGVLMLTGAL